MTQLSLMPDLDIEDEVLSTEGRFSCHTIASKLNVRVNKVIPAILGLFEQGLLIEHKFIEGGGVFDIKIWPAYYVEWECKKSVT